VTTSHANVRQLLRGKARDLAHLVRTRRVSSVEVTRATFEAIAELNSKYGAFVELDRRRALRAAHVADERIARGGELPSFLGVPTGIKDHEHMRGMHTRVGSRALTWVLWPLDGVLVQSCRDGGFVLCGKLATSELAILPYVDTAIHPPALNPLDTSRYAGGSSGGPAAAVASGMLSIAPGSDGAGSTRIPASFCGLVGWKASRHVVYNEHRKIDPIGLASNGPIAHDVRDAALLLDVLAGRPMHSERAREDSFIAACERAPKKLRIRFCVNSWIAPVDPEIQSAVRRTAKLLEEMGHDVDEGPTLEAAVDDFLPLMSRLIAGIPLPKIGDRFTEPVTRWLRAQGRRVSDETMWETKLKFETKVFKWFGDADVWLMPTTPSFAPKVGSFAGLEPEALFHAAAPSGSLTAPFNASGQPAVTLPAGRASHGLPIGVQLIGRVGADHSLFGLAATLEAALGASA
jgi:amidase